MKSSILHKLETLRDRYEEVGHLLSSPDIISDQDKFRNLSKEYSELEEVAAAYTDYEQAQADFNEAEVLASDEDPEMRAMGQDELQASKERMA
ncbi:MAG: PCRF domain-containing protein, partial [Thalassolituus sp.]